MENLTVEGNLPIKETDLVTEENFEAYDIGEQIGEGAYGSIYRLVLKLNNSINNINKDSQNSEEENVIDGKNILNGSTLDLSQNLNVDTELDIDIQSAMSEKKKVVKIFRALEFRENEDAKRKVFGGNKSKHYICYCREKNILKYVSNYQPHITPNYHGSLVVNLGTLRYLGLVMDEFNGKSIDTLFDKDDFLRKSPIDFTKKFLTIFQQVFIIIYKLHQLGVAHRDIKEQNILVDYLESFPPKIDNFQVKIIDFGLSISTKYPCFKFAGSPYYIAPEIWKATSNQRSRQKSYHQQNTTHDTENLFGGFQLRSDSQTIEFYQLADIWSLGVLMHLCLYPHQYPYDSQASNIDELEFNIVNKIRALPDNKWPPCPTIDNLIDQCLQDRFFRPSAEKLIQMTSHILNL